MPAGHASRVRALYRRILLLHRVLPPDLKALGDQYMKDEFRRHKTVGSAEAQRFLQEWEAKLGMGTTGEKKVEGSGMLEAPLLEGEFYIPFICDHGKLWQILEGIQLGTFLFKDHWKKAYAAVLWQQANENRQNSTEKACFGTALPEEKLNNFRDEQIGQLQELMQEATKPNRQFSITESKKPKF